MTDAPATGHYRRLFDLDGKVALVTGGAGILGRRFAAALADCGAAVAVADIEGGAAEAVAAELSAALGRKLTGFACDVADPASVEALAAAVEAQLGPVSVLVNNAATKTADRGAFLAALEDYELETWRAVMAVNLEGLFLVARRFGGAMAARGEGSIVQVASIYGHLAPDPRIYEGSAYLGRPISTPPVYTASKAGVIGLTRHLATHWGAQGVRVNSLTPGGVESGQNEAFKQRYGARIPLGRMAEADEIAGALLFLASDASRYVTGHNLVVDGGLSAW